jgi:hypothetical protein
VILQRPIERAQMQKLLAAGKTDLLQFVSARTRRGFSAFLVRQKDGKIGFEFEARESRKGKGARAAPASTMVRVLGPHPDDNKPVELHAGRYGPYVKHDSVNATLSDKGRVDALTLDEALLLLAARSGAGKGGEEVTAARRAKDRPTGSKSSGETAGQGTQGHRSRRGGQDTRCAQSRAQDCDHSRAQGCAQSRDQDRGQNAPNRWQVSRSRKPDARCRNHRFAAGFLDRCSAGQISAE